MKEGIVEIFGDVVARMTDESSIAKVNYIFGNDKYIKDALDTLSKIPSSSVHRHKFPLVALFTPFVEKRGLADYETKASVNVLIACSSRKEWSNEKRLENSFEKILRPLYERLFEELKKDSRIAVPYSGVIPHTYSENYGYGRYGAYTQGGEPISEPIDAINIGSLEITIKKQLCNNRLK